jgi:predicted secreted protein
MLHDFALSCACSYNPKGKNMSLRKLLPVILLLCTQFAWADSADHYNRVTFQSEASREVPNDLLVARMSIEINDKHPEHLAQQINTRLNAALKTAAAYPAVKASSGDQSTEAVYDKKNHLTGYRGHAEIRLESRDFAAAAQLIAKLQASMQLAGIDFSVAPETRRQVESELIAEAVSSYKRRAGELSVLLYGNGSSYKLVGQAIRPGGNNEYQYYSKAPGNDGNVAAPAPILAGGKSVISMKIASIIEIAPPTAR